MGAPDYGKECAEKHTAHISAPNSTGVIIPDLRAKNTLPSVMQGYKPSGDKKRMETIYASPEILSSTKGVLIK